MTMTTSLSVSLRHCVIVIASLRLLSSSHFVISSSHLPSFFSARHFFTSSSRHNHSRLLVTFQSEVRDNKNATCFPDHFSVWVFFSLSLSREVLGLGMSLSGTPWGRPKKTLVIIIIIIIIVVVAPYK